MLKAENLQKSYNDRLILKGVTIKIPKGKIVGLLGPNGAGKTTTFRCIIGFEKPDSGKVLLNNKDITNLPPHKRARKGLAFLPQEPSVFFDLTVWENIFMFAELIYKNRETAIAKTKEVLRKFKLLKLRHSKAGSLSGGERRRLEIARLFIKPPDYLLLDEPFAGVDPKQVEEIKELILHLRSYYQKTRPIGILITDHNVWETMKFVEWVYILDEGKILFEGRPWEAANNPEVRKRYLGESFTL